MSGAIRFSTRVAKPATPDGCWGVSRCEPGRRLIQPRSCRRKARRGCLVCGHHTREVFAARELQAQLKAEEAAAAWNADIRTWVPEGE